MIRHPILSALLMGLVVTAVHAQWRQGGKDVPDTEWRKTDGDFGAMFLVTDDPKGFFERWNRPPSPDYKPELTTASSAKRGDTVAGMVLFTGCAPDPDGNCDSEVDFKVLYPDGSTYADLKGAELWKGKPAPSSLQVSVGNLGLEIEDDDPFGVYRLEAVVRDNIADRKITLRQTIEVVDE